MDVSKQIDRDEIYNSSYFYNDAPLSLCVRLKCKHHKQIE